MAEPSSSDTGVPTGSPTMNTTVLVTGASGFIGSHLVPILVERGYRVRAMTRHPDSYTGAGEPVYGDVADLDSLRAALNGVGAAYYLVHSLADDDFEQRDAEAATAFGHAAADAGLSQIIYLGGLGDVDDNLSPHYSPGATSSSCSAWAGCR